MPRMDPMDFYWKVDNEGLDYAILHCLRLEEVPLEIEDAWSEARFALVKIQNYLDKLQEQDEVEEEDDE